MTNAIAPWRATYTPGNWLVMSGPTSVVVMVPPPARMSALINQLWTQMVSAQSLDALLELFAAYGMDGMPDLAAFFWDADGLHGIARGNISVVDTEAGEVAFDGEGVRTWREADLGDERHLRIDMEPVNQDEVLQLPLVVGAATASAIYINCTAEARLNFPAGPGTDVAVAPETDEYVDAEVVEESREAERVHRDGDPAAVLPPRVAAQIGAGAAVGAGAAAAGAAMGSGDAPGDGEELSEAPADDAPVEEAPADPDSVAGDPQADGAEETVLADESTDMAEPEHQQTADEPAEAPEVDQAAETAEAFDEEADGAGEAAPGAAEETPEQTEAATSLPADEPVLEPVAAAEPISQPTETDPRLDEEVTDDVAEQDVGQPEPPQPEPAQPETEQEPDAQAESTPAPDTALAEPEPGPAHADSAADAVGLGILNFDSDEMPSADDAPEQTEPPRPQRAVEEPPAGTRQDPVVVAPSAPEPDDDDGGTIFSTNIAATHKAPQTAPGGDPQVLATWCPNRHPNAPGSRQCRICGGPVDPSQPQLTPRPLIAGVNTNYGDFANIKEGVLVGRAPDATKGPQGAHVLRVSSPSSDISRSHLLITVRDWNVVVTDLNSTHGTPVMPVGEQPFVLANGQTVTVGLGTILDLGDGVSLRIEPPRG